MCSVRQVSRFIPLAVVSALILSCAASVPPPGPVDSQSSGLAIALKMNEKMGPLTTEVITPAIILFVRLEEGEDLGELTNKRVLIPSTFVSDEYAYLLNVPSGRYVAVAAIQSEDLEPLEVPVGKVGLGSGIEAAFSLDLFGGEHIHRNYFSQEMVAETMTTVAPASFAFMGSFSADQSFRFGEGDDVQVHFLKVLEGEDVDRTGFWQDITSEGLALRLTPREIGRGGKAKTQFCKKAKDHLKGTAWVPMIDRLMAAN